MRRTPMPSNTIADRSKYRRCHCSASTLARSYSLAQPSLTMTSPSRSPFSALRRSASSRCSWSTYPRSIRSVPSAVRFASLAWSISVSVMLPTPSFRSSRIARALSARPCRTLTVGFPGSDRLSSCGIQARRAGFDRAQAEQLLDVLGRPRTAEQKALDTVATDTAQLLELRFALDAFGNDTEVEPVPEPDDRLDEPEPAVPPIAVLDERAVDLQHVDGKAREIGQ